jgi:hypothetical protein
MMILNNIGDPDIIPDEWLIERMRIERNRLLSESDWTQTADDPTGKAAEWATYRQALRDFPATWTAGPTANFPDPPSGGN